MQKDSVVSSPSSHSLATFLSPTVGPQSHQKGWCSERVPLRTHNNNGNINSTSRRHISTSALTPPSSGRTTLPSKWEDAERWICSTSPIVGNSTGGHAGKISYHQHYQRRPKSKSGPLGGHVGGVSSSSYYLNFSPALMPVRGSNNFMVGSPFSTGVLGADRLAAALSYGGRRVVTGGGGVARSVSIPGWSDLVSEPSQHSSQDADEKLDGSKDGDSVVSRVISRRDMATQISPDGSNHSSPKARPSFSPSPPSLVSVVEDHKDDTSEFEVRDVQVDKRTTVIQRSRRHGKRVTKKKMPDHEKLNRKVSEDDASSWDIIAGENKSQLEREEAKIAAWENLQKAKAEAAIRELEMKLEKKRSASVDKILKKLKVAERKAQQMRNSVSTNQGHEVSRTPHKKFSLGKNVPMGLFRGCFICHAS